jgi:hypothetical protein
MPDNTNPNSPKLRPRSHIITSGYSHCVQIHWFIAAQAQIFIITRTHVLQFSPLTAINIVQPSDTGTPQFSHQTALTIAQPSDTGTPHFCHQTALALTIIQPSDTGTPHKINHNSPIMIMWPHHFINVFKKIDWFVNSSIFCTPCALGIYDTSYSFLLILWPFTSSIPVTLFKFHVQGVQQIDRLAFLINILHSLHYLQHFLLVW